MVYNIYSHSSLQAFHGPRNFFTQVFELMEAIPQHLKDHYVWFFANDDPMITSLATTAAPPSMRHAYMLSPRVPDDLHTRHGLAIGLDLVLLLDGLHFMAHAFQINAVTDWMACPLIQAEECTANSLQLTSIAFKGYTGGFRIALQDTWMDGHLVSEGSRVNMTYTLLNMTNGLVGEFSYAFSNLTLRSELSADGLGFPLHFCLLDENGNASVRAAFQKAIDRFNNDTDHYLVRHRHKSMQLTTYQAQSKSGLLKDIYSIACWGPLVNVGGLGMHPEFSII